MSGRGWLGFLVGIVIAAVLGLLLGGCSTEPRVVTQRVEVPVVMKCAEKPTDPVVHPDQELARADDRRLLLGLAEDRAALLNYRDEVTAKTSPCWGQ